MEIKMEAKLIATKDKNGQWKFETTGVTDNELFGLAKAINRHANEQLKHEEHAWENEGGAIK